MTDAVQVAPKYPGMRVQPSIGAGLVLYVGYLAIFFTT